MAVQKSYRKHITKKNDIVMALAFLGSNQSSLTAGSPSKINLNDVLYDVGNNYDTTNHKFVVPVRGLYQLEALVAFTSVIATHQYIGYIYVNSAELVNAKAHAVTIDDVTTFASIETFLNEGDVIEMYANPNAGASTVAALSGLKGCRLMVRLVTKEGRRQ